MKNTLKLILASLLVATGAQAQSIELGHASDTTLSRGAAAVLDIEGVSVVGGAEATVASATTTDLGALKSTLVSITGTTTITGFGTVAAGTKREGRFTGILTLTHNGTSLILPGGANITTAAGDRFGAVSLGSGNWVVNWYTKASGAAVVGGGGGKVVITLDSFGASHSPVDATTYYIYPHPLVANTSYSAAWSFECPVAGTISRIDYYVWTNGTLASNETSAMSVRLNNTTDIGGTSFAWNASEAAKAAATGLSQAVVAGDDLVGKLVTATWATNPTSVSYRIVITIDL